MNRLIFILLFVPLTTGVHAQSGYVKFSADSIVNGFIRFYTDRNTGEQLIEFWQSKNQDKGVRYHKSELQEYGIGKDRYFILKNFQAVPSEDFFYDAIEAKVIESGTIELMRIPNPVAKGTMTNNPASTGGAVMMPGPDSSIDVIRFVRKNTTLPVPIAREEFQEFMRDQFSEKALEAFEKEEGKLTPAKLRKFVKFYNKKTAEKSKPQ